MTCVQWVYKAVINRGKRQREKDDAVSSGYRIVDGLSSVVALMYSFVE